LRSGFGSVPRTRFNGSVGQHRVVGGCDFDLATMKEMRLKIPGATVNDVVVAIVGGAMRNYLKGKSELPSESMVAMAPISVRTPGEKNSLGNQVSAMTIPIGTHIADPIARLSFVHDEAENSKALTKAVGARELSDYSKFTPSMLTGLAARLYVGLGMANRIAPMFNTVITNIPGPPVPLYMNGARLVTQYGLGPVFEGMGIIHPVFSNFGRITISFTSDRDIMPDPEHYQDCIQESFEEMRAATLGKPRERTAAQPKAQPRKKARRKKVALATVDGAKVGDAAE
jgi:diacylglycerol O-acyltransferase